jgi:hypothetical protein
MSTNQPSSVQPSSLSSISFSSQQSILSTAEGQNLTVILSICI